MINLIVFFPDAVHAFVFEAGQAPATEMVCGTPGQAQKEDNARVDHNNSRPEA